jgi:hypothetical protein
MKQRFLMWGLASIAFVVTLVFSSWHEGLWPYGDAPIRSSRVANLTSAAPMPLPAQPFAPAHPAPVVDTPVVTAATPPQAPQQPEAPAPIAEEAPPPMPVAEAEADTKEFLAHRDRASEHSSRAR